MKSKTLWALPLLAAIVTWISCGRGHTLSDEEGADSLEIADSLENDSAFFFADEDEGLSLDEHETEVFGDFIFAFMHNKRFQAGRVQFPLPVTGTDGSESTIANKQQFREEFKLPGNDYYTLLLGDKSQMDVFQNDSSLTEVTLQYIQLGHPDVVKYNFDRKDGRWFLTSRRNEPMAPVVKDFLNFYEHFSTDSVFQQESLAREVSISMEDPEGEMGGIEGIIEADQWPMFRPEMPTGSFIHIDFGQSFPHPDHIYFLKCGISNGMMDVFTFRNEDGRWKMTGYEN